jgi:hypothetical protein
VAGRPRPGLVAVVVVLVAAFLGWVVWAALGAARPDTPAGTVSGFRVVSDEIIRVEVRVLERSDRPVACSVQALDRTREVVGYAAVRLRPGGDDLREDWVRVRTRDRAVTAVVGGCVYPSAGD